MNTQHELSITIDDERVEFVRGIDAGYKRRNALLTDLPNGDVISIYRAGREWIEAHIRDGICRRSYTHKTRREACLSAATAVASARALHAAFSFVETSCGACGL